MSDDVMPQWFAQLFAAFGPAAFIILGLLFIIKYLLDKDKIKDQAHLDIVTKLDAKIEFLQKELLSEARSNAHLSEEVKKAIMLMDLRRNS